MGKAGFVILLLLGLAWYHLAGPGAPGHSPRGTALAFARAAASSECPALMEERFPDVAGARAVCSPEIAEALRAQTQVIVASNDGHSALVECFYGST
ncbi:MAG: hypothetical protein KJZ84_15985 [Bryobacteraceae bacterium]|nr:hypothetical protein [Bryobacteraceae bacterium]